MTALAWLTAGVWLVSLWCLLQALRAPGVVRKVRPLLTASAAAAIAALATALLTVTQMFQAFSGETLIAIVTITPLGPGEFEATYAPAAPEAGQPARAILHGDQWEISGGVVKWRPWLTACGLKSYHKPTRLSGRFASLQRQRAQPPDAIALGLGADAVWEALYRAAPYLPIIDAAYGSAASAYVEAGVAYDVYVSLTGYVIRRRAIDASRRIQ